MQAPELSDHPFSILIETAYARCRKEVFGSGWVVYVGRDGDGTICPKHGEEAVASAPSAF